MSYGPAKDFIQDAFHILVMLSLKKCIHTDAHIYVCIYALYVYVGYKLHREHRDACCHVGEAEFTLIWMDETQGRGLLRKEYGKKVLLQLLGSEPGPGIPDNLDLAAHPQQAN